MFRGVGLCYFTVRIKLYTEADWAAWLAFKPLVERPPLGVRPKAQDIAHPLLDHLGVSAAVVEDVTQAEQAEAGEWIVTIKFIEFRRPKVALAKPEAAAPTPGDPVETRYIQPLISLVDQLASEP